jgi:hypothetical protein
MAALASGQYGVVSRAQLIEVGFGPGAIQRRLNAGRLNPLHRGVYAVGHRQVNQRGLWLAAVLASGEGALLSHGSAAALWGLQRPRSPIDVTSHHGRRGRRGIAHHEGRLDAQDRTVHDDIPVTSLARTVFDMAEVVDEERLARILEEADRLKLLRLRALEATCERGRGRRAVGPVRRAIEQLRAPATTRSPLEDRFAAFRTAHRLPPAATNVLVLGHEVECSGPLHGSSSSWTAGNSTATERPSSATGPATHGSSSRATARSASPTAAWTTNPPACHRAAAAPARPALKLRDRAASRRRSRQPRSGSRRPARPSLRARLSWPARCPRSRR